MKKEITEKFDELTHKFEACAISRLTWNESYFWDWRGLMLR